MTAAAAAPAKPRAPRAASVVPLAGARLLWVELRHNAIPFILPLIAALLWFDSYRPSMTQPPVWALRTFWNMGQGHTIIDFGPFVAGVAAWMGSREGRRGISDLITAAARPRWTTQLATWTATAIWAVGAYLVFVGVMFGVYIAQGILGAPPWWWVAVGAAAVLAFSAAGFAVGAFFPSRFAAPLAAFGSVLVLMMSSQTGFSHTSGWALILPTNSNGNYQAPSGIFYPYLPDLPIARIMLLTGITITAVGLLGLPSRAGSRGLRRIAAVVTLAGVAMAGTAIGLATTARLGPGGIVIPALHDAANDRQIPATPACSHTAGTPVCLNPVYRPYLADVTTALHPVLAELAGLPGAPARAIQVAGPYNSTEGAYDAPMTISGHPPVLSVPLGTFLLPGTSGFTSAPVPFADFVGQLRAMAVHAFVGAGAGPGTMAQQAVQAALLRAAGVPFAAQPKILGEAGVAPPPQGAPAGAGAAGAGAAGPGHDVGPASKQVYAAARRLAALPPAARHAWLAAHLGALRSGHLTLAQLP
jgi:hypothetical protein